MENLTSKLKEVEDLIELENSKSIIATTDKVEVYKKDEVVAVKIRQGSHDLEGVVVSCNGEIREFFTETYGCLYDHYAHRHIYKLLNSDMVGVYLM